MKERVELKPRFFNVPILILLIVWLLLVLSLFWKIYAIFLVIILGITLFGVIIINPKNRFYLTKEGIILKYWGQKEKIIPINKIRHIYITRSLFTFFTRILAIKVKAEILRRYKSQITTKKWDFFMYGLSKKDMDYILNYVKKVNPRIGKVSKTKKSELLEEIQKKIKLIKRFNWFLLLFSIMYILLIGVLFSRQARILFEIYFLLVGLYLFIRGFMIRKMGLDYGLAAFSISEAFGERVVVRGGWAKISWIIQFIGGIILVTLSLVVILLDLFLF